MERTQFHGVEREGGGVHEIKKNLRYECVRKIVHGAQRLMQPFSSEAVLPNINAMIMKLRATSKNKTVFRRKGILVKRFSPSIALSKVLGIQNCFLSSYCI